MCAVGSHCHVTLRPCPPPTDYCLLSHHWFSHDYIDNHISAIILIWHGMSLHDVICMRSRVGSPQFDSARRPRYCGGGGDSRPGHAPSCSPAGELTRLPRGTIVTDQTGTETEHQGHNNGLTVGEVDIARLGWDPSISSPISTTARSPRRAPTAPRSASGRSPPTTGRSRSRPASSSRPGPTTGRCRDRPCAPTRGIGCASTSPTPAPIRTPCTSTASTAPFRTASPASVVVRSQIGEQVHLRVQAKPFGCHLYHCHATPLKRHIHKGLYGAYIVNPDPAKQGRCGQERGTPTMPSRRSGRSSSW